MSDSGVVPQIEILTYLRVRSVINLRDALLSNMIWGFKTTSKYPQRLTQFLFVKHLCADRPPAGVEGR
jgi:hypothetical protein